MPIKLTINGKKHKLTVEPRVTLLDAMRDRLDHHRPEARLRPRQLRRVHGHRRRPHRLRVLACSPSRRRARTIRTVEGLTEGTVLHPVQQAFCDHDGTMCGFCTPGFVMSAVALLEKNPKPTPEQARAALDGNICRCGTYTRVLEAVLEPKKGVARG